MNAQSRTPTPPTGRPDTPRVGAAWRWLLPGLVVLGLLVAATSIGLTWISWRTDPPEPVVDRPLAQVNLDAGPFVDQELALIALEDARELVLRYTLADVQTSLIDLALVGPDGTRLPIQSSEGLRTDTGGGGEWRQMLPAGEYTLRLTAEPGAGVLTVYDATDRGPASADSAPTPIAPADEAADGTE